MCMGIYLGHGSIRQLCIADHSIDQKWGDLILYTSKLKQCTDVTFGIS